MTTLLARRRPPSEPGRMLWSELPGGARSDNVREVPRRRKIVAAHCETRHPDRGVVFRSWCGIGDGSGTYRVVPFVALFGSEFFSEGESPMPINATGGTGELLTGVEGSFAWFRLRTRMR